MISWLAATRKTSGICSAFAKPSSGVIGLKASSFPSGLLPRIKPGEGRVFLPCIYFFSPLLSPRRSRDIPRAASSSPSRGGAGAGYPAGAGCTLNPRSRGAKPWDFVPKAGGRAMPGSCSRFRGSQLPLPAPCRHPRAAARGRSEQPGCRCQEREKAEQQPLRPPTRLGSS